MDQPSFYAQFKILSKLVHEKNHLKSINGVFQKERMVSPGPEVSVEADELELLFLPLLWYRE